MLMKRHYKRNEQGELVNPPVLSHVEVKHTGARAEQNFSDTLVLEGLQTGLISIKGDFLTLHVKPEALIYRILRVPGRYAVEQVREGSGKDQAIEKVKEEVIHHYECVLDAKQHEKYRVKKGV